MNDISQLTPTYQHIIENTLEKLSKLKKQIHLISTIRIGLFLAGVAGIIYFFSSGWLVISAISIFTFIPFLALVKYHNKLFYKKEYMETKVLVNENELSAINYQYSCFDSGKEYIDPSHPYSFDLDLFGDNSLFQYVNRTSTSFGKEKLACWFKSPLNKKEKIEERQKAIKELAPELSFRQKFLITGMLYKGESADKKELLSWASAKSVYKENKILRTAQYAVPSINLIILILAALGIVSFNLLGLSFIFFLFCSITLSRGITKMQAVYGKKLQILSTYAGLMGLIEQREMKSDVLKQIQGELIRNHETASSSINRLTALMNGLDQRSNILIAAALNGFMFWEVHQVIKIESWKEIHAGFLPSWLDAVGEIDALCSLATYSYNHPDYSYPIITDKSFVLKATAMGHPLMNRDKCVKNDVDIHKRPFFVIITGANMAGKSTYLRTIGVNYLLACIGAPTCSKEFELYPAQLMTSLRTSDSLTDNESYFFAELKRLKAIIDRLTAGEELFIILDEILKGTNSMDKQKGSLALLRQLIRLNTNGIIATHDLLLGTLIEQFPENIRNYCFEAEITHNELIFSYLMKEGIAQNMNACFLMNKMGIVVKESNTTSQPFPQK